MGKTGTMKASLKWGDDDITAGTSLAYHHVETRQTPTERSRVAGQLLSAMIEAEPDLCLDVIVAEMTKHIAQPEEQTNHEHDHGNPVG